MYLQDYQILGGIFTPKQLIDCNEAKGIVVMRGLLTLGEKDFCITVRITRGRFARIVKVAGKSVDEAMENKGELLRLRTEGIRHNEGDLRKFVWNRFMRTIAWGIMMLSFTFGFSICCSYAILHGFKMAVVVGGILFFVAMLLCRRYRLRIISPYPGIAFFTGGH